jgi:hypothetical protein
MSYYYYCSSSTETGQHGDRYIIDILIIYHCNINDTKRLAGAEATNQQFSRMLLYSRLLGASSEMLEDLNDHDLGIAEDIILEILQVNVVE